VHTQAGSPRIYPKGSLVLDMIKYVIGEDEYKRSVLAYLKAHPYSNVDTHDFYVSFLETTGINLDWFFDEWLYKGGEPHYKVSYEPFMSLFGKGYTQITVTQTQEQDGVTGLFKMPIVFEVHYVDGSTATQKEWIENATQVVKVANPDGKEIEYVLFDPNSQVIKAVEFEKRPAELKAQGLKAKNMIDRYDAIVALAAQPFADRKGFLVEAYLKEPFWANRAELVKQLAPELDSLDAGLVKRILTDPNARVRQALLDNSGQIPAKFLTDFETLLSDSSYWIEENALVKLSNQYPKNTSRYLEATKNDKGIGNKVHVAWLEVATGLDRNRYLPQLVEYASPSYEFRARGYAFAALARLNYLDEKLLGYLVDAALNPNTRLANPAKQILNDYKQQTEYKKLLRDYDKSHEWKKWQDDVLKPVLW
jgi:aminopeptidase N